MLTFTAMHQDPENATNKATKTANDYLRILNEKRARDGYAPYTVKHLHTTMTICPGAENDAPWFVFTLTISYGG